MCHPEKFDSSSSLRRSHHPSAPTCGGGGLRLPGNVNSGRSEESRCWERRERSGTLDQRGSRFARRDLAAPHISKTKKMVR